MIGKQKQGCTKPLVKLLFRKHRFEEPFESILFENCTVFLESYILNMVEAYFLSGVLLFFCLTFKNPCLPVALLICTCISILRSIRSLGKDR